MPEIVILVPGVGLAGAEMIPFARALRKQGFDTSIYWHCPWCGTASQKAKALSLHASKQDAIRVHFVGHSLGGILIAVMLQKFMPDRLGRVVTLGSPLNGSKVCRGVRRLPLGRFVLGSALAEFCVGGSAGFPPGVEVAGIAGSLNLFIGYFLGIAKPNDTLISTQEAITSGMTDSAVLRVSHGSMLLSRRVAEYVVMFLSEGRFPTS